MSERIRRRLEAGRWADVDVLRYKDAADAPFSDVTRQLLFGGPGLAAELRYFEVGAGGCTTLERHQHLHAVLVLRGRGRCLVGQEVSDIGEHDLVTVPAMTWHQFRAADDQPLGFLCMVDRERDRPQLPGPADLEALSRVPEVARFLCGGSGHGRD